MKTTLLSLSALLIIIFGFRNQSNCPDRKDQNTNIPVLECPAPPSFAETIRSEAIKHSDDKSSDITDQDWYSKAMENIQKEEYNISYNKEYCYLGNYTMTKSYQLACEMLESEDCPTAVVTCNNRTSMGKSCFITRRNYAKSH